MTFCFHYNLSFPIKTPLSSQSFRKPVFENHVARSTTRSIFWHPSSARGLAQTPTQQRNKVHHRKKCAAQGDSKKVVEEECIARARAHNISEQTKKLLFLRNNLHLRTQSLRNGRLTLWRWLCGLASWLGLTSWLLEWSPGPGFLGPRLCCRFLRCLARTEVTPQGARSTTNSSKNSTDHNTTIKYTQRSVHSTGQHSKAPHQTAQHPTARHDTR